MTKFWNFTAPVLLRSVLLLLGVVDALLYGFSVIMDAAASGAELLCGRMGDLRRGLRRRFISWKLRHNGVTLADADWCAEDLYEAIAGELDAGRCVQDCFEELKAICAAGTIRMDRHALHEMMLNHAAEREAVAHKVVQKCREELFEIEGEDDIIRMNAAKLAEAVNG